LAQAKFEDAFQAQVLKTFNCLEHVADEHRLLGYNMDPPQFPSMFFSQHARSEFQTAGPNNGGNQADLQSSHAVASLGLQKLRVPEAFADEHCLHDCLEPKPFRGWPLFWASKRQPQITEAETADLQGSHDVARLGVLAGHQQLVDEGPLLLLGLVPLCLCNFQERPAPIEKEL